MVVPQHCIGNYYYLVGSRLHHGKNGSLLAVTISRSLIVLGRQYRREEKDRGGRGPPSNQESFFFMTIEETFYY